MSHNLGGLIIGGLVAGAVMSSVAHHEMERDCHGYNYDRCHTERYYDNHCNPDPCHSSYGHSNVLYSSQIAHAQAVARRPVWQGDNASPTCMKCKAAFGFLKRRHHCRACGVLCCDACSQGRMLLPQLGYCEYERVCVTCKQNGAPVTTYPPPTVQQVTGVSPYGAQQVGPSQYHPQPVPSPATYAVPRQHQGYPAQQQQQYQPAQYQQQPQQQYQQQYQQPPPAAAAQQYQSAPAAWVPQKPSAPPL